MLYYLYDGSFNGLLSAVYQARRRAEEPDKIVKTSEYRNNLFAETLEINTDPLAADELYNQIKKEISTKALKRVYYAFLSEQDNIDTLIYRYLRQGFRLGGRIEGNLNDRTVMEINKFSRKVGAEKHRLLGLIRFRQIAEDILYAPVEPDNNLLTLLAPHFALRMSAERWIIHDVKRETAVVYNRREWVITTLKAEPPVLNSSEEGYYQQLWKDFFASIAIANRKNPRLQRQFMPSRYWKHLIEK